MGAYEIDFLSHAFFRSDCSLSLQEYITMRGLRALNRNPDRNAADSCSFLRLYFCCRQRSLFYGHCHIYDKCADWILDLLKNDKLLSQESNMRRSSLSCSAFAALFSTVFLCSSKPVDLFRSGHTARLIDG